MLARTKSLRPGFAVFALLLTASRTAAAQVLAAGAETTAVSALPDTLPVAAQPDTIALTAVAPSAGMAHARAPEEALEVGIAASFAPVLVALALDPAGRNSPVAPEAAISIGAGLGIIAGPAVGLVSGGRGDLATRGVIIRTLGAAAVGAGVLGFWVAFADERNHEVTSTSALMILGAAGGLVTAVSWVHDLAITPAATARGKPLRAELGVRPDGLVAVRVRF